MIYRTAEVPQLAALLASWRKLALAAGLPGLHVVQNNGVEWTPGSLAPQPGVDGVAEYFPNLRGEEHLEVHQVRHHQVLRWRGDRPEQPHKSAPPASPPGSATLR